MKPSHNRETMEETPEYRSIAMRPLSAPMMPRSFASMKPAKAAIRPVSRTAPSKDSTISQSIWKVSELPALPADYALGRTNIYVDGTSQEIADRICSYLRSQSVAAKVESEQENLLTCENSDCLKFEVRMFSDSSRTVVEMQRIAGCSFQFREVSRSLLRSAKGSGLMAQKRKFTVPSCIPKESAEQKRKRMEVGIQTMINMLLSNRVDSEMLALEGLERLTESPMSCSVASYAVLNGECFSKLLSWIEDDSSPLSVLEDKNRRLVRRRALAIVANSVGSVSRSGDLNNALSFANELKSPSLVSSLVSTLEDSEANPIEASKAAAFLQCLMVFGEVREALIEMNVADTVGTACSVGSQVSFSLERESKKLKLELDSCT